MPPAGTTHALHPLAFAAAVVVLSVIIATMFERLQKYLRRRKYKAGAQRSQFLAPDIRRDVELVDVSELEEGYVTARIRTGNVLYALNGLAAFPEFETPRRVAITDLWKWKGQPWGGPVPDDDISRVKPGK